MVGGFIVGGPPIGGPFGGIGGAVGPVGRGGPPGGTIWLKFDAATPVGPTTGAPCWGTSGVIPICVIPVCGCVGVDAIGGGPPPPTRICDIWVVGGAITAGPGGVAAPICGGGIIDGGRIIPGPGGPPGGTPVAAGGRDSAAARRAARPAALPGVASSSGERRPACRPSRALPASSGAAQRPGRGSRHPGARHLRLAR